jgi:hypothetical protein
MQTTIEYLFSSDQHSFLIKCVDCDPRDSLQMKQHDRY